jgi:hypothetical protein
MTSRGQVRRWYRANGSSRSIVSRNSSVVFWSVGPEFVAAVGPAAQASEDRLLGLRLRTCRARRAVGDGPQQRTITPSVPVRVDYRLTALGRTILPVVGAIKHWSESHIHEIHAARTAYDRMARPR